MQTWRPLWAFWRIPYSTHTARRFAYALAAPPLALISLGLAAVGRADAAARCQRSLARRLVGLPASEPLKRPRSAKVIAAAFAVLVVGVACWSLLWNFTYAILPLPLAASFLGLALAGRAPAIGRLARQLANQPDPQRPHAQRPGRDSAGRVVLLSLLILAVGAISWALLQYFVVFAMGGLAFPFVSFAEAAPSYGGPPAPWQIWSYLRISSHAGMWSSTYVNSNGGPTVAGAWTYHAAQFLITFAPLFAWLIRGLTRLSAWLTQALLGTAPIGGRSADQLSTLGLHDIGRS